MPSAPPRKTIRPPACAGGPFSALRQVQFLDHVPQLPGGGIQRLPLAVGQGDLQNLLHPPPSHNGGDGQRQVPRPLLKLLCLEPSAGLKFDNSISFDTSLSAYTSSTLIKC